MRYLKKNFLIRTHSNLASIALSGSFFFTLTSCTNNLKVNVNLITNTVQAPPPKSAGDTGGTFTLSRVIQNTLNPTTVLDLIGDGSGTFGDLCQPSQPGAASSTAPTVCACTYSYNSPTAPNQKADTPVIYHETNLLRCNYSQVPADVTTLTISVHVTSADTYSNTVNFNFNGTGTTVNTSLASSFIAPVRYQCRDIIYIPSIFDGSVYDPFQSEDIHLTYPLDYYAGNLGGTLSQFVTGGGGSGYNCPPILNPNNYLTSTALTSFNTANHLNLNVYSRAPLSGNSNIYPPTPGIFDRSTFYVATQASGVFNLPLNSYIAPGLVSSATPASPPLGYGASPIASGIGTGQESCPDTSIPIPSGFHWVKVWLFRASLPQRHYASSGQSPSLSDIQSISCNPGSWAIETVAAGTCPKMAPVFAGCYNDVYNSMATSNPASASTQGFGSLSMQQLSVDPRNATGRCASNLTATNIQLVDRVFGGASGSTCVRLQSYNYSAPTVTGNTLCANNGAEPGPGCDSDINNSSIRVDTWSAEIPWATESSASAILADLYAPAQTNGCSGNPTTKTAAPITDPLNICSNARTLFGTASPPGRPNATPPFNLNLSTVDLDVADANARFDFLFVVTPTSISTSDMQNTTASSTSAPYLPYRFFTNEDCLSPNPNNPTPGDCLPSNVLNYGLKLHDVASNGDPPPTDPNRAGVFPVCALQPN